MSSSPAGQGGETVEGETAHAGGGGTRRLTGDDPRALTTPRRRSAARLPRLLARQRPSRYWSVLTSPASDGPARMRRMARSESRTPTLGQPNGGAAPASVSGGMYLHWEGRRGYRTRMPAPRVIEPVADLSFGEPDGSRIIEGDNLQVMVSLRSHYQGAIDVAYLDPPYNIGKKDFPYSDRRYHDPNADADDMVYV